MFLSRLPFCVTFGSVLDSILEVFWEPSSPLYSFLVAGVAKRVPKEVPFLRCVFAYLFSRIFGAKATSRRGVGGEGGDPSGDQVILHLGPWRMILPCVFAHSVQRPPRNPKEKSLK